MRQLQRRSALRIVVATATGLTVLAGAVGCSDNEGDVDEDLEDEPADDEPDDDQDIQDQNDEDDNLPSGGSS